MLEKEKLPNKGQIDEINANLSALTKVIGESKGINTASTWSEVASMVRNGTAKSYFDIGDQVVETFTDNGKTYDMPLDVVDFDDNAEMGSGETQKVMYLQSHYTIPFGAQFSGYQAFLRCPNGLAVGTYHLTLGADWGTYAKKGAVYQFTITKTVESGGRLGGFHQMPDVDPSNWKVYSYNADGKTLIETVDVISGNAGTDLGTMNYDTRNENLNSMQECAYGHNRWKTSALRQWLNSNSLRNYWWNPQTDWDIAPSYLATHDGFLCGISQDMIDHMIPVKQVTYPNTKTDDTTGTLPDVTYDKVFLPSFTQMFCDNDKEEGQAFEYYKRLKADGKKATRWTYEGKPYIKYGMDNHKAASTVFSRSAYRDGCNNVYELGADGHVFGWNATGEPRSAPSVCIG